MLPNYERARFVARPARGAFLQHDGTSGARWLTLDAESSASRRLSFLRVGAQGAALTPTTEYYVWDQDTPSGSDNVLLDFVDSDGPGAGAATLKTRYLLGDVVDQVLAQETIATSEVLWLLQDNLGSVRETVKNDGAVNSRVEYDPFGNMVAVTDPSNGGAATTLKTRLNFTGQEYDTDLKLIWYSDGTGPGRWYDPATGTFISEDPLGFLAGDANLYRYVGNGPTIWVDPSGRWYLDFNFTGGGWLGITCGVFYDDLTGIHPYFGGGVMTPGVSASVTCSPLGSVSRGWGGQVNATAIFSASIGVAGGSFFWEGGLGAGFGASVTGYFTW